MPENVSYHKFLEDLATSLKLTHSTLSYLSPLSSVKPNISVIFLLSVPDALKQTLLDAANLLIYTPRNEHFGIVPLEAMLNGIPVLAANEGGPLETVVDGETGWLRDVSDVSAWTSVMQQVLSSDQAVMAKMGNVGRERVLKHFSKSMMAEKLQECLDDMQKLYREPMAEGWVYLVVFGVSILSTCLCAMLVLGAFIKGLGLDVGRNETVAETVSAATTALTSSMGVRDEL